MGDGWRLVVQCPDGATVTTGVRVDDHDEEWCAKVRVGGDDGIGFCRHGESQIAAVTSAAMTLFGFGYIVREIVPPGEHTADERVAAATPTTGDWEWRGEGLGWLWFCRRCTGSPTGHTECVEVCFSCKDRRPPLEWLDALKRLRTVTAERDVAKEREARARLDFAALESDAALVVRAYEDRSISALERSVAALRAGGRDGWVNRALRRAP